MPARPVGTYFPPGIRAAIRPVVPSSIRDAFNILTVRRIFQELDRSSSVGSVFVHIPKTGGISITRWLARERGLVAVLGLFELADHVQIHGLPPHLSIGHLSSRVLRMADVMRGDDFARAYCFTLVRHPIDRVRSLHSYLRRQGYIARTVTLDEFVAGLPRKPERLGLVGSPVRRLVAPMSSWVADAERLMTVEIHRFEDFDRAVVALQRRYGITSSPDALNAAPPGSKAEISAGVEKMVRSKFAIDFERFGYEPL